MAPPRTAHYKPIDRGYRTPCWIWQGAKDKDGYPVMMRPAKMGKRGTVLVYKFMWEKSHGALGGRTLDHLCRQRACVRPSHLEPVSMSVNSSRREAAARRGKG